MSGPTPPKRRRVANPRARTVKVPKPLADTPFSAELALVYGLDEAGRVARERVKVSYIARLDWVLLTLQTNPGWAPERVPDASVPGGERGLVYRSMDGDLAQQDGDQLDLAQQAIARATLAVIAAPRARQTLKAYVDAEVERFGSKSAFAKHLVDLAPGPRKPGESARDSRKRQVAAQVRKLQEWTQLTKKNGTPANAKRPGHPKYELPGVSKLANNAQRIAAARGDPRRYALGVLRELDLEIGLRGWWRALSDGGHKQRSGLDVSDYQFPADAESRAEHKRGSTQYIPVATVRKIIEQTGADFIEELEGTKHDAELLVVYLLKVSLLDFRHTLARGSTS